MAGARRKRQRPGEEAVRAPPPSRLEWTRSRCCDVRRRSGCASSPRALALTAAQATTRTVVAAAAGAAAGPASRGRAVRDGRTRRAVQPSQVRSLVDAGALTDRQEAQADGSIAADLQLGLFSPAGGYGAAGELYRVKRGARRARGQLRRAAAPRALARSDGHAEAGRAGRGSAAGATAMDAATHAPAHAVELVREPGVAGRDGRAEDRCRLCRGARRAVVDAQARRSRARARSASGARYHAHTLLRRRLAHRHRFADARRARRSACRSRALS